MKGICVHRNYSNFEHFKSIDYNFYFIFFYSLKLLRTCERNFVHTYTSLTELLLLRTLTPQHRHKQKPVNDRCGCCPAGNTVADVNMKGWPDAHIPSVIRRRSPTATSEWNKRTTNSVRNWIPPDRTTAITSMLWSFATLKQTPC